MKPADVAHLVDLSDPRVSPDGSTVAFVVTTVDLAANDYRSAVWVAGTDGGLPPCPFTDGSAREARPRWSPDGQLLAFVRHPDETGSRLCVSDIEGSDVVELLEWPEEIDDLVWSPDGERLFLTSRERDESVYGPDKDKHRPPRTIDRLAYRVDSIGWTIDRPKHVLAIAVDGSDAGRVTALTSGPAQDTGLAVAPDGASLVFSSNRTDTWDTDLSTHLYRIATSGGGELQALTTGTTTHASPSLSPDGAHVAFVWGDRHSMMRHGQIGVVSLGDRTERLLTAALDLHCAPYLAAARDPVWDSPSSVVFQADEAGNVPLYRASLDGVLEKVVGGDRQVTSFDAAGGTLAFVATDATHPPELFVVVGGEERRLTRLSDPFLALAPPVAPERFVATSSDGTPVEAWLMRPAGSVAGVRHPMLLDIHGGPFSQYGNRFFDEFQVLARAGYVVVYGNPRGSSGYGEAFARAIRGPRAAEDPGTGWGGCDYEDAMAIVATAVEQFDCIDGTRLGVLGGSYGGYLTSWIVGHTTRFKAALSERAVNNLFTFSHTSDIGASFPAGYIGSSHLDDPDEFARQSPVTYYRDITTPVLIVHSEVDLRCPIEQAEDLYLRLKKSGRDVEFVRFPGESHELSRSGAPQHRVRRFELILGWFARKL